MKNNRSVGWSFATASLVVMSTLGGCGAWPSEGDVGTSTGVTASEVTLNSCPTNDVRTFDSNPALIAHPKVFLLFWGIYWTNNATLGPKIRDALVKFWNKMGNAPSFWRPIAEYGVGTGSYIGAGLQLGVSGTGLFDGDIQPTLLSEIGTGVGESAVPPNDESTIYVILLPGGSTLNSGTGYHHLSDKNGKPVWYAVVQPGDQIAMDRVITHELYEAATDPDKSLGWMDFLNDYMEIVDLCPGLNSTILGETLSVPWSQTICDCLVSPADSLQLATLRFDTKQMMHTVRLPTGFWDAYQSPKTFTSGQDLDLQTVGNTGTHSLVVNGGVLNHAIRDVNGTWSSVVNASSKMGFTGSLARVSGADVAGELGVCAVDATQFYQAIRHQNGTWTGATALGVPASGTVPTDVDCAGDGSTLYYVAATRPSHGIVSTGSKAYYSIRAANGTGSAFAIIPGAPPASRVSATVINGELHVVVLSSADARPYHGIRRTSGSWTSFTPIGSDIVDVTSAPVGGELHVIAQATTTNKLYIRIRHSNGTWTTSSLVNSRIENSGGTLAAITTAGGVTSF
jgi:hypothetical protein